jgi:hypothetical protein
MITLRACTGVLAILAGISAGPPAATAAALQWAAPMPQEETIYRPDCPVSETSVWLPLQFAGPREGQP